MAEQLLDRAEVGAALSRCVANECRSACGLMPNRVLQAATYFLTSRSTLRVDSRPPR